MEAWIGKPAEDFSSFLQPRSQVLSPTQVLSLSRSVGTDRSEAWERGRSFLFFVTFEIMLSCVT